MEKLAELKERLKKLSPEELEELKAFIAEEEKTEETVEGEDSEETVSTEDSTPEGKAADDSSVASEEDDAPETMSENESDKEAAETPSEATESPAEAEEEAKDEEGPTEELKDENDDIENKQQEPAPVSPREDDDIPAMQKVGSTGGDDAVDEGSGEQIPVDYEQIIAGLNAKVAALTAENASLKSKVDGAFGYSAKTAMPAKVNRLYDECEGVHIHK